MKKMQKNQIVLLILTSILIITMTYFLASEIFHNKSYDYMVKRTSMKTSASNEVALVIIDNKSLMEIGRWPWSRGKYLQIFNYFKDYTNISAYLFDAVIVARDKNNPKEDEMFFKEMKEHDKLVSGIIFDENRFKSEGEKEKYIQELDKKNDIKITDLRSRKKKKTAYKSFTQSPFEYFKNVHEFGSVNTILDQDGYLRKGTILIEFENKLYPSVALIAYSKRTGIKEFTLNNNFLYGKSDKHEVKIPVKNTNGNIHSCLKFYKINSQYYSHKVYSASDIMTSYENLKKGKAPIIDPKEFDNKIVIIGSNANAQGLEDIKRTPVSDTFAGPGIHATSIENMLRNDFIINVSDVYNLLLMISMFALIFIIVAIFPTSTALVLTSCTMFTFLIGAYILYTKGIAINFLAPEIFMIIAIGIGYSYRYIKEGIKKQKIEQAMGKYISQDVMKNVVDNIDEVKVGGKRADVSILFIDIRGFTTISERLSAIEVSDILNEYFSELMPIITKYKGTMNKFIGDAMLVIFGEPIKIENHALNAVLCANEMLIKVKNLQQKWIEEGKPKIEAGIGIATGEVFIGNIGTEDRLEYTVIGDTVNTASRIENFNKVYKTKFLISENTYDKVQKYVDVLKIREVEIRGKTKKVNIYEVLRIIN